MRQLAVAVLYRLLTICSRFHIRVLLISLASYSMCFNLVSSIQPDVVARRTAIQSFDPRFASRRPLVSPGGRASTPSARGASARRRYESPLTSVPFSPTYPLRLLAFARPSSQAVAGLIERFRIRGSSV